MAQLAVIDQGRTREDQVIRAHHLEDYIYLHNLKTRAWLIVLIGTGSLVNILMRVDKGIVVPTSLEELIYYYILPYGGFLIGMLILYTALSTYVATKKYAKSRASVAKYRKLLKALDKLEEKEIEGDNYDDGKRDFDL